MRKLPLILPSVALLLAAHANATVYLTEAKVKETFYPKEELAAATVELTQAQADAIADKSGMKVRHLRVNAWKTKAGDWLVVDEVLGKHEFITYAVAISKEGAVKGVEIMEYKETYGGEVRGKEWRGHFTGKTAKDPLKLEGDIPNISGATLSSRHVTEGVRRVLATVELLAKTGAGKP